MDEAKNEAKNEAKTTQWMDLTDEEAKVQVVLDSITKYPGCSHAPIGMLQISAPASILFHFERKLIENGKIERRDDGLLYPRSVERAKIVSLKFRETYIWPSGEVGGVEIYNSSERITLTGAQALTVAKQILSRLAG